MKKLILIGFAAWLFVGCATLRPGGRVVTINDSEPDPDRDDGLAEKAKQVTSADFSRVAIVKGKIPEGILLEESGGKISIDPRFKDEYQVLGTVESDFMRGNESAGLKNIYWTHVYEDMWRNALCWPQAPLKAITLGIWALLPTAYPCYANIPGEEKDREKAHLQNLKKLGAALGANMVLVTTSGSLKTTTVDAKSGAVIGQNTANNFSLKGYAILRASKSKAKNNP